MLIKGRAITLNQDGSSSRLPVSFSTHCLAHPTSTNPHAQGREGITGAELFLSAARLQRATTARQQGQARGSSQDGQRCPLLCAGAVSGLAAALVGLQKCLPTYPILKLTPLLKHPGPLLTWGGKGEAFSWQQDTHSGSCCPSTLAQSFLWELAHHLPKAIKCRMCSVAPASSSRDVTSAV